MERGEQEAGGNRQREGASKGNKVMGGRDPRRRARTSVPRLQPSSEGPAARGARGAQPGGRRGGGARRSLAAEAGRWGPDAAAEQRPEKRRREL